MPCTRRPLDQPEGSLACSRVQPKIQKLFRKSYVQRAMQQGVNVEFRGGSLEPITTRLERGHHSQACRICLPLFVADAFRRFPMPRACGARATERWERPTAFNRRVRRVSVQSLLTVSLVGMGLFSSSEKKTAPDPASRQDRQRCWDSRDAYFACLDAANVVKPGDEGTACNATKSTYEKDCARSWVRQTSTRWLFCLD